MNKVHVPFSQMKSEFKRILIKCGFSEPKAEACAQIFADNSLDGINSHGVNRFPRFVQYIRKGFINVKSEPRLVHSAGAIEQWDGQLGAGPLNAQHCTARAVELAREFGLGCVAIANTNHWMRGGTYGWQAARSGCAFIGWTNTEANMPAWGARDCRLGNNPLVMAVPFENSAIVLDIAMSQYSYGKLEAVQMENNTLPYPGGFNSGGELTNIPSDILISRRALPIGYWKGAGLSLLLDILAVIFSAGLSTKQLSMKEAEYSVSQVFIAFCTEKLSNHSSIQGAVKEIIKDFKNSEPDESGSTIRFPGEQVLRIRGINLEHGIPVNQKIWNDILNL